MSPQEDPNLLEKTLYEVSTPGNDRYSQYLEQQDIKRIIKPAEEGRRNVLAWLERSGIKITSDNGERLRFMITVDAADSILGTTFRTYQNTADPTEIKIRTLKVMVPHDVADSIDLIHPTTYFDNIKPLKSIIHSSTILDNAASKEAQSCGTTVTPSCLEELYDMKGYKVKDPSRAGRIGVPGFLGQVAQFKDLDQFIRTTPSRAKVGTNFTFSTLNSKSNSIPILNHNS
jgi:tripeptidyl-peptidase-1